LDNTNPKKYQSKCNSVSLVRGMPDKSLNTQLKRPMSVNSFR
jgi:hypothetical protein